MHYYQFNIADYRKDTGFLTYEEHGIYRQLIDQYHLDEKPFNAGFTAINAPDGPYQRPKRNS